MIPGRNVEDVLRPCLDAVVHLLGQDGLEEIIVVDDGSTDGTADIVADFAAKHPVRLVRGRGRGAAAARNLGWREARAPLIWFIDADCVAEPDALRRLLPYLGGEGVAGVGGSYANMRPDSLVASLVHEEIVERHRRMPSEVSVLATFNVIYRRDVLEEVGGFDPAHFWAHDAELAFRVRRAGYRLRFVRDSRVAHFHPTRLWSYLGKQRQQGYYRVVLYLRHPGGMLGDSYSGLVDYVQPPLAMLMLAALPLLAWPTWRWVPAVLTLVLLLLQMPMTGRIVWRLRAGRYALFAPLGFLRAIFRGMGMSWAVVRYVGLALCGKAPPGRQETVSSQERQGTWLDTKVDRMKVWYVTMVFPVPSERFANEHVRALQRKKVDISVCTLGRAPHSATSALAELGFSDLHVSYSTFAKQLHGMWLALVRPVLFFSLVWLIVRWSWSKPYHLLASLLLIPRSVELYVEIERELPDVVHLFWGHYPSLVGHLVSRHLPTQVLSMSLGAYDLCMDYGCSQPVARGADVVRSLATANVPAIQALGVPNDRILVVYDSVSFSHLDAVASIGKIKRRIVSAGRLIESKGMRDVLEVFSHVVPRFPDASLVILGDGPERQRLQQRARRLGIEESVEFLGHVSHETVFHELAKAEVFLFLSCHEAERLPNVVKEAMASRCLSIASDTVGIEELLLSGRHGYVVSQRDVPAASRRLDEVFSDFDAHRDMIDAARDHVRSTFDIDNNMAALVERWDRLVREKRDTRGANSVRASRATGLGGQPRWMNVTGQETANNEPPSCKMNDTQKIRVLHVVHSLERGGIEMWLLHVLQTIDRDRFAMDVMVTTTGPSICDEEFRLSGARVIPCPQPTRLWRYGRNFRDILERYGPYQIVHSHFDPCGYPLIWAHKAGVPVRIAHSHNPGPEMRSKGRWVQMLGRPLARRWIDRHANAGLAASVGAASAMFGPEWQTDGRWKVSFCGIDLSPFAAEVNREQVRTELGLAADALVVGHVGKFSAFEQKNQSFLLEVVAELAQRRPSVHLLLIGDGPRRARVEREATELGVDDRTTFLGSRSDVARLLKGAVDVFAFPSLFEGLGLALVEAQAAGLPCVCSDVIPEEADVVPELIARLSLSQPASAWAEEVARSAVESRRVSPAEALAQVERSPFHIERSVESLQAYYTEFLERARSADGGGRRPLVAGLDKDSDKASPTSGSDRRLTTP